MERFVLTDAQWAKMPPHCLGKPTDPGRTRSDNRCFLEGILWIVRTGSPWRDLPEFFGNWNTVFKRYRDWVIVGNADGAGIAARKHVIRTRIENLEAFARITASGNGR